MAIRKFFETTSHIKKLTYFKERLFEHYFSLYEGLRQKLSQSFLVSLKTDKRRSRSNSSTISLNFSKHEELFQKILSYCHQSYPMFSRPLIHGVQRADLRR